MYITVYRPSKHGKSSQARGKNTTTTILKQDGHSGLIELRSLYHHLGKFPFHLYQFFLSSLDFQAKIVEIGSHIWRSYTPRQVIVLRYKAMHTRALVSLITRQSQSVSRDTVAKDFSTHKSVVWKVISR